MSAARALIACDGCAHPVPPHALSFRTADARECRYCADCDAQYASWLNVLMTEESRLNGLLDIFIAKTRDVVPLHLVPQDLPKIMGALANLG